MARQFRTITMSMLLVLLASACGQAEMTAGTGGMAGATTAPMDHGAGPAATETTEHGAGHTGDAPFDAQFIDSMIEHHRGAITMAEQALKESERAEIKELAQNIITSQRQEVDQMTGWRTQWYPNVPPTGGMGMAMDDIGLSDASLPFDQRFITAMIAHHEGAITMAKEAQAKAEHAEIKQLARTIITAQEAEVAQMQQWQSAWFGS